MDIISVRMTEYTKCFLIKETAAKELAVDFTDKVYDAYVSPKKGKIDSAIQTDLNFFMIYYVFPAILLTEHDAAKLIADHLCSRWGEKFKNSKIQYTDYDSLYVHSVRRYLESFNICKSTLLVIE